MSATHALYRFHSTDGTLLYVGITADPGTRWRAHSHDKPWWHEVANVTVEQHPDRKAVLEAERAAIIAEQPRYNVVHNRGRTRAPRVDVTQPPRPPAAGLAYDEPANLWTFHSRESGNERTVALAYHWEVNGTPMSDDWLPEEIDAYSLLKLWAKRYAHPSVGIYWSLRPVHEAAPFQRSEWKHDDFLTYFTWPHNAHTGEPINFNRVPVLDLGWNDGSADKGGFFQEATGWKPAPLADAVDLHQVFAAAGIRADLIGGDQ